LRYFASERRIVEGVRLAANDLASFVPFASDDKKVTRPSMGNCDFNRVVAIGDLDGSRSSCEDRAPDFSRSFVSRIVVRHVDPVRQADCHPSH
jgi:hypothetical protein